MSGIRIVNETEANRKPAATQGGTMMLLWAGLVVLLLGAFGASYRLLWIVGGLALCALSWVRSQKVGKKVCPNCRTAIDWEAGTCPSCQSPVE